MTPDDLRSLIVGGATWGLLPHPRHGEKWGIKWGNAHNFPHIPTKPGGGRRPCRTNSEATL